MSSWTEVARLTLSRDWLFTSDTTGRFFRVRHLQGRRVFSGWIAQADNSEPSSPVITDPQALHCKEQADLYEFQRPISFASRAIGFRRLDDSLSPWELAIDVWEPLDQGSNSIYQGFSDSAIALMTVLKDGPSAEFATALASHEATEDPHPTYALRSEFVNLSAILADLSDISSLAAELALKADLAAVNAALDLKADTFSVLSALADKADLATLAAALVLKADSSVTTAAIALKADSATMAAALALKVDTVTAAAALALKVDTATLTAALATKADTITLTGQTTDATLTELTTPQRVLIKPNSSVGYEIRLVGHNVGATQEFIYWLGSGAIYRGSSSSTTVLQTQTGTRRSSLLDGVNWTPTISADTVNGALKIQVKGAASKTVNWIASVQILEVT